MIKHLLPKNPGRRGKHPNSLKNLTPVKPGEVLNPEGINRKRPFTDRQFALSEKVLPEPTRAKLNAAYEKQLGEGVVLLPEGATFADAFLARQAVEAMTKPDVRITAEWQDRIEGRAPQRLELTGYERQEITIRLVEDPPLPAAGPASSADPPIDVTPVPPSPNGHK